MRTDIAAIVAERNKNYWPAKASSRESLLSEHRRSTPISATNRQLDLLLGLSIFRSIRLRVGASCSGRSPTMTTRQVETVIVGGGQAGLALSYYLKQEGREHVVLERAPAVANAWRNQRWDSFTLVTPNFQVRMPGAEYQGNDPYGFMSLAEVIKYQSKCRERSQQLAPRDS